MRSRLLMVVTLGVLACAVSSASAATITVTTTSDDTVSGDGLCSLRKAIDAVDVPGAAAAGCAAAAFGPNTIVLPTGTYTLGSFASPSELLVSPTVTKLTIVGAGVNLTTISGGEGTRVLEIPAGPSVSLSDLTITDGQAPSGAPATAAAADGGTGSDGGAILNAGSLSLTDVSITHSAAGAGGAGGAGGASATTGGAAAAAVTAARSRTRARCR